MWVVPRRALVRGPGVDRKWSVQPCTVLQNRCQATLALSLPYFLLHGRIHVETPKTVDRARHKSIFLLRIKTRIFIKRNPKEDLLRAPRPR
jgi:hypothetical protein